MKFSKFLVFAGLAAILTFSIPGAEAPAFEGSPNPQPATLYGPELWGVIVVNCELRTATLRVKKIEGCEVEKQAELGTGLLGACPNTDNAALYYRFPDGVRLFGETRDPIITKIRNWEESLNADGVPIYSFDAQIKFADTLPTQP